QRGGRSGGPWTIAVAAWAAGARVVGLGGGSRLRFENSGPVEFDIGVVFFDPADGFFVKRGAADLDAWGRAKPIENALPRPPVAAAGIDE
ncbi:MAG TPA: hypothetical protein VGC23_04160, partial [Vicinamibacterales bacterium]